MDAVHLYTISNESINCKMPVVAVLAWSIVLMIVVNDILRSLENYNIPSEKEHLDARDCVSLSFLPFLDVFT